MEADQKLVKDADLKSQVMHIISHASSPVAPDVIRVVMKQVPPKATVVTEEELAQMRRRAVITSLADEEAARARRENLLEVTLRGIPTTLLVTLPI